MFINLVKLYSTTIQDNFSHIGGKLGEITNQRRETVAIEMISFLLKIRVGTTTTIIMTPLFSLCRSSPPLYVDHHLRNIAIAIGE